MVSPPGGAAGRPGSTAVWWMSSPLRLQKLRLPSSGRDRLLSPHPLIQVTCLSGPLARHPEGPGGHHQSARPGRGSQKRSRFLRRVHVFGLKL